jgi:mannose-6-phosphate isomerase-like protein (cupin superfamily)
LLFVYATTRLIATAPSQDYRAGARVAEELMAEPGSNAPGAQANRTLEVFGETVIIRTDPTGALLDAAMIEEIVPPGMAAPLHSHGREDEIAYVIEGMFRIWRGDEVFDVGAGGMAMLPRRQPHTFKNIGPAVGRLLTVILPAGFERFFEVIVERGLGDEDMDEIAAIAADFGLEILGPPPA